MYTMRQIKSILRYHLGLKRWFFIHIPKNAGMAIRNAHDIRAATVFADPYFHASRRYTAAVAAQMKADGQHHGFQHARLRDIARPARDRLQPVAIVRNPWARTASRYAYLVKSNNQFGRADSLTQKGFEAFLEERHDWGGRPYYWHRAIRGWYPQADYVTLEDGTMPVDCLRQEDLAAEACAYFGVPSIPVRNVSRKTGPDPMSFYTDRTRQIVADWYAADIALWDFDFDTPARRNVVYPDGPPIRR